MNVNPPLSTQHAGILDQVKNSGKTAKNQNQESGKADSAQFSEAGLGRADFSSSIWSPSENTGFTMSTYTSHGTLVEVKSGIDSFTFGKSADKPLFKLSGADAPMNMELTLTHEDGKQESYTITESTKLYEDKHGNIFLDDGNMSVDDSMSAIVINLDDNAHIEGTNNNDILLNFARNASMSGLDGNDVLMSMGDNATLKGNEGNDLMKVVRDVIRKENVGDTNGVSLEEAAYLGFDKGVSAILDGGDGDDSIESEVKLVNSQISGGDGNDKMRFTVLQGSSLDAGAGDDEIVARTIHSSSVNAGAGNDKVKADTLMSSNIDAGSGDDEITVNNATDSSIDGGDGNDKINVKGTLTGSKIEGGAGDDHIKVSGAFRSIISGGAGNDIIELQNATATLIDGGDGDDIITVEDGLESSIIQGGKGNDTITLGTVNNSIIDAGAGDDVIKGENVSYSMVLGGDGNDKIRFEKSFANIIDGGSGADLILAHKNSNIILNDNYTLTEAQYNLKGQMPDVTRTDFEDFTKGMQNTLKNFDSKTQQTYLMKLEEYQNQINKRFDEQSIIDQQF